MPCPATGIIRKYVVKEGNMKPEEMYSWLMENGGPVIKYRTAAELMTGKKPDMFELEADLLKSPLVRTWLDYLVPAYFIDHKAESQREKSFALNEIHGSKPALYENIMGRLTDFGIKKGIIEFDKRTQPFRAWLKENTSQPPEYLLEMFMWGELAAFLARAGYEEEPVARGILQKRLDTVYSFVCKGSYEVYVDPARYRAMPASFRRRPLVNPELNMRGDFKLPLIYDIVGWAQYLPEHGTEEENRKIDTIISYIFNESYQKLDHGYGVVTDDAGHYWSMGWSVHLPGFMSNEKTPFDHQSIVQLIDLLINFRAARRQAWFKETLAKLEDCQTGDGTYIFPREYLQDRPMGYWISGVRMGLEENRRLNKAIEVESTFWMAKFHKALKTDL
jgi:hypothetical protein